MQTLLPPKHSLTKSELITAYIQQMALPSMWPRVLSESDYELWDTVLDPYSIQAIKFAFDSWIMGAKKFPAPSDILPLCGSYAEQQQIAESFKEKRTSLGLSPELAFILAPEIVKRAQLYHKNGINPAPPIEESEIHGLVELAKQRIGTADSMIARFPNGNPRYNKELMQARALAGRLQ